MLTTLRHAVSLTAFAATALGWTQTSSLANHDQVFPHVERFAANAEEVTAVDNGPVNLTTLQARQNTSRRGRSLSAVYVFRYPQPGQYKPEDVNAYRQALVSAKWTCTAEPRHGSAEEHHDHCSRPLDGGFVEEAEMVYGATRLTLMHSIKLDAVAGQR